MLTDLQFNVFQSELLHSSVMDSKKHELFTEAVTVDEDFDSVLSNTQSSLTNSAVLTGRSARLSKSILYRDKRRS